MDIEDVISKIKIKYGEKAKFVLFTDGSGYIEDNYALPSYSRNTVLAFNSFSELIREIG